MKFSLLPVIACAAGAGVLAYGVAGRQPSASAGTGAGNAQAVRMEDAAGPAEQAARRWVAEVFADSPAALAERVRAENALPSPDFRKLDLMLQRWAALDPEACLAALPELKGPDDRWTRVLTVWIERAAPAAMEWFAGHAASVPPDARHDAGVLLVAQVADLRLLSVDWGPRASDYIPEQLYRKLAETDLPTALGYLDVPLAAPQILRAWALTDPEAAVAWVRTEKDEDTRISLLRTAAEAMTMQDPERAARWLMEEPGRGSSLTHALSAVLCTWAARSPGDALHWLRENRTAGLDRDVGNDAVRSIAESANPAALTTGLASWPEAEAVALVKGYEGNPTLEQWQRVQTLPAGPVRDALLARMAAGLPLESSAQGLRALEKATTDPVARLALERAATARSSGAEAMALLRDPARPVTPAQVYALANREPEETAAALAARPDSTPGHWEELMSGWEEVDPAAAARWLAAQPASPQQEAGARALSGYWASEDAPAVSAWVASLPPSAMRDTAAAGLAGTLTANDNPGDAFAWAASIADAKTRAPVLDETFSAFAAQDAEAAAAALRQSALPPEEIHRLLQRAGFPP